jgi:hypothetical protein
VVAHGAILRVYEKKPLIADQVATNYRKADITPRQRAMLDFAMKVCLQSHEVDDADFAALRAHGFRRRGHLGHRRHHRLLRPEQPHGQPDRHAAQRRVLPDGPLGEARSEQGSRLFLSSLCAGFDAATAERAARMPRGLGGLRYLAATLAEIARLRLHEVDIEVDGRPLSSGPHLFVSSLNTATYGAGMPVVPAARIDDGQLDLLCAGRFGRAGALAMLPRLLLGRHLGHPRVQTRRFRQLHLRAARPLPLAADGEPMAAVSELRVVVLHGALRGGSCLNPALSGRRSTQPAPGRRASSSATSRTISLSSVSTE